VTIRIPETTNKPESRSGDLVDTISTVDVSEPTNLPNVKINTDGFFVFEVNNHYGYEGAEKLTTHRLRQTIFSKAMPERMRQIRMDQRGEIYAFPPPIHKETLIQNHDRKGSVGTFIRNVLATGRQPFIMIK
jgi:hypothetical protein